MSTIILLFLNSFRFIVYATDFVQGAINIANAFTYNKYPITNYTLDFYYDAGSALLPWNWGDNAMKRLGTAVNIITNAIYGLINLISYFVGFLVEQAFSLDFITDILKHIKGVIQNVIGFDSGVLMRNGILPGFILILIACLGAYLSYVGLLKRELTRAVSSLLAFIVVMFGISAYSLFSDQYLSKLNDFSKEVSSSMLSIGNTIISPEKEISNTEAIASIRDRLFQIQVQKPYLLLQYGTSDINEINRNDPNRVNSVLSNPDGSTQRAEAVKKEVENGNSNMSIGGLASRLGIVLLLSILNLLFSIIILLFAGAMLYYQVLFLFYSIVLPLNLFAGLVPGFSSNAIKGVTNLLGSVFKRQALCLITSLVFTISNFIYAVSDENKYGFLFVFFLQLLIFYVAYKKSNEVLSIFDFFNGSNKGSKANFKKFSNVTNKFKNFTKQKPGGQENANNEESTVKDRVKVNPLSRKSNGNNDNLAYRNSVSHQEGNKFKNASEIKRYSTGNKVMIKPLNIKDNKKETIINEANRNIHRNMRDNSQGENKEDLNRKNNLVDRTPKNRVSYDKNNPKVITILERNSDIDGNKNKIENHDKVGNSGGNSNNNRQKNIRRNEYVNRSNNIKNRASGGAKNE